MKWLAACGPWLLLAGAVGCGGGSEEKPPFETFPVTGKIVIKDAPGLVSRLERGKVWLQSASNPNLKVIGAIGDDGSFALATLTEERAWPGAPAGKYKVRIEPPLDDERQPQAGLIDAKYLDYDRSGMSITVPASDEIVLEVQRPRR